MKCNRKYKHLIALAVAGYLWLWFIELIAFPYPISMYIKANWNTAYSASWPVSKDQYDKAICLVQSQLKSPEIITDVFVWSPSKITFGTLIYYKGALCSMGRSFTVIKVGNAWVFKDLLPGFWQT